MPDSVVDSGVTLVNSISDVTNIQHDSSVFQKIIEKELGSRVVEVQESHESSGAGPEPGHGLVDDGAIPIKHWQTC